MDYDVIIIGAGPGGIFAAYELTLLNPRLKVAELAMMSGFHSGVTFTLAFRLFLGKTPSDWCREYVSKNTKTR